MHLSALWRGRVDFYCWLGSSLNGAAEFFRNVDVWAKDAPNVPQKGARAFEIHDD